MSGKIETAVFGGGCFWCTEAIFNELKGVLSVLPGYAGGNTPHPTYTQVCAGTTGHAEVIKIEFDSALISYPDLLTVFFATHDPSTLNRQGSDVGTQYRSLILYTNNEQKNQAEAFIKELNQSNPQENPIVTEIKPLTQFYKAEDYHQRYYENNKSQPYCELVINPKLEKVQKQFEQFLKSHEKRQ